MVGMVPAVPEFSFVPQGPDQLIDQLQTLGPGGFHLGLELEGPLVLFQVDGEKSPLDVRGDDIWGF